VINFEEAVAEGKRIVAAGESNAWRLADLRWPPMRDLAQRGWTVFVSIAPMIGSVRLPDDFLELGSW
jgi:hypothetical protein